MAASLLVMSSLYLFSLIQLLSLLLFFSMISFLCFCGFLFCLLITVTSTISSCQNLYYSSLRFFFPQDINRQNYIIFFLDFIPFSQSRSYLLLNRRSAFLIFSPITSFISIKSCYLYAVNYLCVLVPVLEILFFFYTKTLLKGKRKEFK